MAVGPQLGAIALVDSNLLTLDGADLLTLDARLALDAGTPLHASGPLLNALLTLDTRRTLRPLDDALLALDTLRALDTGRAFGTLDSLGAFNPGSTLHALNLLRPLDARSALALHLLRALLCAFGPLGAVATVAALTLRTGGGRDCQPGDAGG